MVSQHANSLISGRSGGEMGKLISSFDWYSTSLGKIDGWPQSLNTALSIILNSSFPMFLWWGPDLICFYNDAYRPSLGDKHPAILGMPAEQAWAEIWPVVKPLIDQVLTGGETISNQDQLIPIYRNGNIEDGYWSFNYSAINAESGKVGGVLVSCTETTINSRSNVKSKHTLAQSEKQFRQIVLQSPIPMAILKGRNHVVQMANKIMLEKIWRREEHEIIGKQLMDVFPELEQQKYPALLKMVFDTGTVHNEKESVAQIMGEDGLKTFFLDYEFHPLREENGSVFGIMVTVNDVTEKVEARKKIEENEERLRMAIQSTNLGTWEYNPISGELNWSDACKNIYGLAADQEVDFEIFAKHIHPDDRAFVEQEVQKSMQPGSNGKYDTSYRIIRFDNSDERWVRATGKVYFNNDNKAERFIGTVVDITSQRKYQKILVDNEQRIRLAIEAAELGTFDLDLSTQKLVTSERLNEIFGFPAETNISRELLIKSIHPDDKFQRNQAFSEAAKKGSLHYEARIVWPDNSIHWIRVFGKVIDKEEKLSKRMYGIVMDITAYKKSLLALEESESKLNIAIDATELGTFDINLQEEEEFICSSKYLEIYGFGSNEKPTRKKIISRVHPDDLPARQASLNHALSTGILDHDTRIIYPDNSTHWIRIKGKVVYDNHKKPDRILGTVKDITKDKLSTQQLQENEQRLNIAIQSAELGMWELNLKTLEPLYTERYLELLGLEKNDFPNREEILAQIHPDDIDILDNAIQNAHENGLLDLEMRTAPKDKHPRWLKVRGKVFYDELGHPEKMLGTLMDITETKTAFNALQENEERLNIVVEASELGTWDYNIITKEVYFSDRFLQIFGYTNKPNFKLDQIMEHFHPDDNSITEAASKEAGLTGTLRFESRIIWENKSIHWIDIKGKLFFDEHREPTHMVGTIRDITQEKYFQQELLEREKKFRLLADTMPQFVWTGNAAGGLNYFNESVYNYSGLTREEVDKNGWLQIVHPDEQEENIRSWIHSVQTGTNFLFEHRFRRHDGEYRWQLSRAIPQKDANGNILMWVGSSTDIQEQKIFTNELEKQVAQRTKELEKVNNDLEKSNSELEQFAYIASHDLQEPLRKIQFFAERLEQTMKATDETSKNYYQKIQKASERMKTLIKDLLDFSRLSKLNEAFVATDLNMVIKNIILDFELLIQQKQAIVEIGKLPIVEAIPLQMQQLFYNLISNSLKFSIKDTAPIVKVTCTELSKKDAINHQLNASQNYVLIKIKDNGIGFDQEYAQQIFVIFQRLNDVHSYGGTGIGLALCKKIVLAHHGEIYATSKENEGAEFSIILPLAQHKN